MLLADQLPTMMRVTASSARLCIVEMALRTMKKPKADADASSGHKPKPPEALKLDIDFEFFVGAAIAEVVTANGARRRKRKFWTDRRR